MGGAEGETWLIVGEKQEQENGVTAQVGGAAENNRKVALFVHDVPSGRDGGKDGGGREEVGGRRSSGLEKAGVSDW